MKKIIITLFVLTFSISFGQEINEQKETSKKSIFDRKHEVKIGAVKLLAGPILETTYEYISSKDFTYGASLLANLQSESEYPEDFSVTPFARFYFQESKEFGAKGFFVEGFAKYSNGTYYNAYDSDTGTYTNGKKYNAAALGLSLGKKWINTSGFVFETLIGFGRRLGNNDAAPEAFFRGDLCIGYRF